MAVVTIRKEERERLFGVKAYILNHLGEGLQVTDLARRAAMNERVFNNSFRQLFGFSAGAYILAMRMGTGKFLLIYTDKSISEIAGICGYRQPRNFSTAFKKFFGRRPGDFRIRPELAKK